VGAWVAAILLINEVPDLEADARAGKRTLVVRFGPAGARTVYLGLTALALAASLAAIAIGALPPWYVLPAAALALGGTLAGYGISVETAGRPRLRKSIELTLGIHALGSITLCLAILAHRFA